MASTAAYISQIILDAAGRQMNAAVEFFAPGIMQPQLIPIRVHAVHQAHATDRQSQTSRY